MRYTGPSCRQCRREGTKLFLKGTKCFTEKCPVERRPYAPGQHGQNTARRRKMSEYAKQLREKQKIKRIYGISEAQFRNTFERVSPLPGITGHNLLAALESRLDNVVYRMGFAASRKAARQLIRHRHVEINGKSVDIPSFQVQPGEAVRLRQKSREVLTHIRIIVSDEDVWASAIVQYPRQRGGEHFILIGRHLLNAGIRKPAQCLFDVHVGARGRGLAHRLPDDLAAAEDHLVTAAGPTAAVLGDLDDQIRVREPDAVAGGGPVQRGVPLAVDLPGAHGSLNPGTVFVPPNSTSSTVFSTPGSKRTAVPAGTARRLPVAASRSNSSAGLAAAKW